MRSHAPSHLLLTAAILLRSTAGALDFQAFTSAIPQLFQTSFNDASANTSSVNESDALLLKRADNCPSYYNSCANLGAAAVCCVQGTTCSADAAGHVACCPSGAVCTGVITGIITAGTVDASGAVVTATASGVVTTTGGGAVYATPTTTSSPSYVGQTTTSPVQTGVTTNSGFIVAGSNTVATIPGGKAARGVEIVSGLCRSR